jgi:hypothetical protein
MQQDADGLRRQWENEAFLTISAIFSGLAKVKESRKAKKRRKKNNGVLPISACSIKRQGGNRIFLVDGRQIGLSVKEYVDLFMVNPKTVIETIRKVVASIKERITTKCFRAARRRLESFSKRPMTLFLSPETRLYYLITKAAA